MNSFQNVFLKLFPNGRVVVDEDRGSHVLVGREEFLAIMGELYDAHCLCPDDIRKEPG